MIKKRELAKLRYRLLGWYRENRRELPWRRRPTLYDTLVAEFMLQQTRVDQVVPYYRRFVKTYPTLKRLAKAPLSNVVKLWEGLGYYRRAQQLHQTAKRLAGRHVIDDQLLKACPGIGSYTYAAVSSIVWDKPNPVVDGNVKRVLARFLALKDMVETSSATEQIQAVANEWMCKKVAREWNQAVMELGATVCTPRHPNCSVCPLCYACRAYRLGTPESFPKRREKKIRPHKQVVAGLIRKRDGRVLIGRRPSTGLLPNLWEFPGGVHRHGVTLKEDLRKRIREDVGIAISVEGKVAAVGHAFSHFSITLHVFDCRYARGIVRSSNGCKLRWVRISKLHDYAFSRAHRRVVDMLTDYTRVGTAKAKKETAIKRG